jgi:pimeloyl-[acyl-carrier protein] methyl ester esterase
MTLRAGIFVLASVSLAVCSGPGPGPGPGPTLRVGTPRVGTPRVLVPAAAAPVAAFGHGSTVVLVQGPGSDAGQWLPVARQLGRQHRVVLADLPAPGTGAGRHALGRATQTLDLALVRSARGPVVLVGHSFAGLVAAAEACEHPSRVRALVLVETALRPPGGRAGQAAARAELDRDYGSALWRACGGPGLDSARSVTLHRELAALDPAVMKAWMRLGLESDLSSRIERLRCPLLVVLAPRSWQRGRPWVETAAALGYGAVPRVRAVRVDDCGYFVMRDRPDELARLIARFAAAPGGTPVVLASFAH